MSLVNFKFGSLSDLNNTPYTDGNIYFIFSDNSNANGHIYLDIHGVRKEISAAYNDLDLQSRISELEKLIIVPCTGITRSGLEYLTINQNTNMTLTVSYAPADCTNQVF